MDFSYPSRKESGVGEGYASADLADLINGLAANYVTSPITVSVSDDPAVSRRDSALYDLQTVFSGTLPDGNRFSYRLRHHALLGGCHEGGTLNLRIRNEDFRVIAVDGADANEFHLSLMRSFARRVNEESIFLNNERLPPGVSLRNWRVRRLVNREFREAYGLILKTMPDVLHYAEREPACGRRPSSPLYAPLLPVSKLPEDALSATW